MRSFKVILVALLCIQLSLAQSYVCTVEKDGEEEFCVFQNVRFFKNTTSIEFDYPGDTKPTNVAFRNSNMLGIPRSFLDVFGDELKVLKAEGCRLQSVTITKNMESLYTRNNFIDKVFLDQNEECTGLIRLDLSSNRLKSFKNITYCEKLKVLNLSANERLWPENIIDFSAFGSLTLLEDLNLSDNGAFYLDNLKNVGLQFLKVLDLSKNDILPSDLRLHILKPFTALEVLKLNDNNMEELDYGELPDFKSLKSVYLNGNNFPCRKLEDMFEFLNIQHSIATPLDRHSNCGDHEHKGMCCKGPLPTRPPPPPRPTTALPPPTSTVSPDTSYKTSEPTTVPIDSRMDTSDSSWQIVLAVVIIIAIVAAGAGYFIYKKRAN